MSIKNSVASLGLTACLMVQPSTAGQLEDGLSAYGRDDYVTALKLLKPLADRNVPAAQYTLGVMYREEQGVPEDRAKGARLIL